MPSLMSCATERHRQRHETGDASLCAKQRRAGHTCWKKLMADSGLSES